MQSPWIPQLSDPDAPLYQRIADAIERDVAQARLRPGDQLPTLKALAAALGATAGTVARAYELAQRRGLVSGEVGRGTFVRAAAASAGTPPPHDGETLLDLSIVKPNLAVQEPFLREALQALARDPQFSDMLDYTADGALLAHRQAGALWLQEAGMPARPEQVLLTCGAQHGLWLAMASLTRPGELVLCEALCYPGVASVAQLLGRRVLGVAMDEEGMSAEALREQCQRERPALVICIATGQNPTGAVMSLARRRAIAAAVREADTLLVDDDLYGFMAPTRLPPLASLAPERSLYLTSLSKSVASTLRLGYLSGPPEWLSRLSAAVRSSVWMVSPLAAQLASALIHSGAARRMREAQLAEATARQTLVKAALGRFDYLALPQGYHLWLRVPSPWSSGEQFVAAARSHQLLLAGGDAFDINRSGAARAQVRVSVMAGSREQFAFGLQKLAGLLGSPEAPWL